MLAPRKGIYREEADIGLVVADGLHGFAGGVEHHEPDRHAQPPANALARSTDTPVGSPPGGPALARIGLPRLMDARRTPVGVNA
jgi:hypothetical protein